MQQAKIVPNHLAEPTGAERLVLCSSRRQVLLLVDSKQQIEHHAFATILLNQSQMNRSPSECTAPRVDTSVFFSARRLATAHDSYSRKIFRLLEYPSGRFSGKDEDLTRSVT